MVSIHRVPVNVLLIISVVYLIFRFKREARRSLHSSRLLALPFLSKRATLKPHADMYTYDHHNTTLCTLVS